MFFSLCSYDFFAPNILNLLFFLPALSVFPPSSWVGGATEVGGAEAVGGATEVAEGGGGAGR